jgi:sulfhydrogenase subunit beta (sulfur reductase)
MMVLKSEDFIKYLLQLQEGNGHYTQVIVPFREHTGTGTYKNLNKVAADQVDLCSYRTGTPPKYLFYFPRERVYPVSSYFPSRIIAGIKACDMAGLEILDKALLKGGFTEPAYSKWRENTLIISSDCSEVCEFCSCSLSDGKPYSERGFDVNLSGINKDYLLTAGSRQGEEFLESLKKAVNCRQSDSTDFESVNQKRKEVIEILELKSRSYKKNGNGTYRKINQTFWDNASKDCIGCGACTNVCPTCYCLILNDETKKDFVKIRSYDSCQWYGYARVAGGGTPRPKMSERFRNRYLCKTDYMKENFGSSGCTGCGRCIEACAGEINFRKVLSDMNETTHLTGKI